VTGNQRGRNASQLNLAGTGIGTFNDRLRDAILGGSPFAPSRLASMKFPVQFRFPHYEGPPARRHRRRQPPPGLHILSLSKPELLFSLQLSSTFL